MVVKDAWKSRLLSDPQVESVRLPLLVTLGLRVGISLWMALVWATVDRYLPLNGEALQRAFEMLTPGTTLVERMFLDVWTRWDAFHYLIIAKFGYEGVGLGEMNFFPLYPFLVRLAAGLCAGNVILGALLISTLSAGLAAVLLYRYVETCFGDAVLARWAVLAWLLYPTSVFLFAPFSDGLFVVFAVGCLLALERRQWVISGVFAALAGLTRAQGILLALPILTVLAQDLWQQRKPAVFRAGLALGCVPLGWGAFMLWRAQRGLASIGQSFAQYSGVYFSNPLTTFLSAIQQAVRTGEIRLYLEILSLLGFGIILVWMARQKIFTRHLNMLVYTGATLILFVVKHSETASVYQSATRYVLSLFPVYIGIAALVLKLPKAGQKLYLTLSLAGLLITSALYALFIFVG